jgi:hypothetical protein
MMLMKVVPHDLLTHGMPLLTRSGLTCVCCDDLFGGGVVVVLSANDKS